MIWCVACQCAVAWSLMADSESPATLFEMLYLLFPTWQSLRVAYDNGCNFLNYVLNRDPRWAAILRVLIDGLHAKGHTACSGTFDTGVRCPDAGILVMLWCSAMYASRCCKDVHQQPRTWHATSRATM